MASNSEATIESFADYATWKAAEQENQARYRSEAEAVAKIRKSNAPLHGRCAVCAVERQFNCDAGAPANALRESLGCTHCASNSRKRAVAWVAEAQLGSASRVYLTEQLSCFYLHLKRRVSRLIGSEYMPNRRDRLRRSLWLARQGGWKPVRHEDVTSLSFSPGSFEAILSMDVLEHVFEYRTAFTEFVRVLKPNGRLIFTVPFHQDKAHSEQLAKLTPNGEVEHLVQPPEYHGDPLSGAVLCFHRFGWDVLAALKEAGFANASALRVRDPAQGLPEAQWVLTASL